MGLDQTSSSGDPSSRGDVSSPGHKWVTGEDRILPSSVLQLREVVSIHLVALFHELVLSPHNPCFQLKEPPQFSHNDHEPRGSELSVLQLFAAGLRVDGADVRGEEALREELRSDGLSREDI